MPERICGIESPGSKEGYIMIKVTWDEVKQAARAPPVVAYRLKITTTKGMLLDETTFEVFIEILLV
jgi:hypothetical protein